MLVGIPELLNFKTVKIITLTLNKYYNYHPHTEKRKRERVNKIRFLPTFNENSKASKHFNTLIK